MEVKGAAFLYTLATLCISFAGFAALLLMLRQTAGGGLSPLDRFITRSLVGQLFMIAAGAVIPPALALYKLPEGWVWKASALLFGLPMLTLLLTYQRRRIAATGKPAPFPIRAVFFGVGPVSLVGMISYIFANFEHQAAAYASAVTVNFLIHGFAFVIALEVILRQEPKASKAR